MFDLLSGFRQVFPAYVAPDTRKYLRSGEHKRSPVSIDRLASGFMIESIFYLSSTSRKCQCVKQKGSHQTVSSELTPRELHPNCRSDRAALIACSGLVTARTVTGREYHCPLCGSWRNRELPDIFSQYFSLAAFRQVMAYRCTRLCSLQPQRECIW